ncbi:hypothetical protein Bbelb_274950 [Branchiostoma belcheri]|nr:hypothetical protein Bbelb_274950 [Branchiostoma belcheri]
MATSRTGSGPTDSISQHALGAEVRLSGPFRIEIQLSCDIAENSYHKLKKVQQPTLTVLNTDMSRKSASFGTADICLPVVYIVCFCTCSSELNGHGCHIPSVSCAESPTSLVYRPSFPIAPPSSLLTPAFFLTFSRSEPSSISILHLPGSRGNRGDDKPLWPFPSDYKLVLGKCWTDLSLLASHVGSAVVTVSHGKAGLGQKPCRI